MNHPYVSYLNIEEKKLAQQFADKHGLTFASPRQIRIKKGSKLVIWITKDQILLQDLDDKNSKPFFLNFRLLEKEKSDRGLLKKCFSKFDKSCKVFDLTAGFCQDAYCISNMGFEVIAYEKESWLFEFTKSCMNFSKKENLKLINLNSLEAFNTFTQKDILFIDPMFEVNSKSLAKKEIQFLRKCIPGSPEREIIDASINSSAGLIVIKRHKLSNTKHSIKPSYVIKGKVVSLEVFDRRGL
ncbi:class I SAM-dependent methyltransferase [SAR86 cluster bacterium]|jgi:16S rRNA G966 N2-methylase RsmD|nr:class I SAM-dependent methyltransferase [SAR86 cluster bacterium]|tara:strand:- start:156 stop:878 length:723 start_codon:yes stop_codon:yes gene_type:complete